MSDDLRKKAIIFFVVLGAAILFLLPTFFKREMEDAGITSWISRPISLGLDLSGGVHLVYQVETIEAVKSRLQQTGNSIRSDLREKKIAVTRVKANDEMQLEVVLLSDRLKEDAKTRIQSEYRDLMFVKENLEGGRATLIYTYPQATADRIERESIDQAVETLRNRVDQFGVAEPLIQRKGRDQIVLQMPGVSDIDSVKRVVGSVAKLEFRLVAQKEKGSPDTVTFKDKERGDPVVVEDQALMTGDAVANARVDRGDMGVEVDLTLTSEGGKTFAKLTSDNVGRELAIILDGLVYSSPVIKERIGGGRARISGGNMTYQEGRQLAVVLRSGALPAPLKVLEERTVGPTLGSDSIRSGIIAILVSALFVFLFMLIYYRKSGIIADISLVVNLTLNLACLSAFGATLTLPGLAGLALSIGMAVDANVLIFERIKDELRNGADRDAAVAAGFNKALTAILDSNLMNLFAALILYYFGTGSVRGFAVTLSIGVLSTIFCACFASKGAFEYFSLKGRRSPISI